MAGEASRRNGRLGGRPPKHPENRAITLVRQVAKKSKGREYTAAQLQQITANVLAGKPALAGIGRPPGRLNKGTVQAKAIAEAVCTNPRYLANTLRRAIAGELHPAVEVMFWHYYAGKPKDTIALENKLTLEQLVTQSWQRMGPA
jgi:hypothetical protein